MHETRSVSWFVSFSLFVKIFVDLGRYWVIYFYFSEDTTFSFYLCWKPMPKKLYLWYQKIYRFSYATRKTEPTYVTVCARNITVLSMDIPRLRSLTNVAFFSKTTVQQKCSCAGLRHLTYRAQLGTSTRWHKEKAPIQKSVILQSVS